LEADESVVAPGGSNLGELRARPPRQALSWAISTVGPSARLVSVRPLLGGISSAVHGLVVEDDRSNRHRLVLRRWLAEPTAQALVQREASALSGLAATPVPAPQLIASDPAGDLAGDPSLLMEWLPGRVNLEPRDRTGWLGQLARVLPEIHETRIDVPRFEGPGPAEPEGPFSWSQCPDARERAADIVREAPPAYEPHFIHGDYQHFNVLWSHRRISGVIDWTLSSLGPRDLDPGHCRLNLAVLFSVEWAERFRLAYEAEAGREVDPWWDLYSLVLYGPDWPLFIPLQAGRRFPVDVTGMPARVDELLLTILRRM
jgi:aminoglycoside phosphotransferase (APT) family kinase protein